MCQFRFGLPGGVLAGALLLVGCGGTEVQDSRNLVSATCDSTILWAVQSDSSGSQIPDNNNIGITVTWDNQNCTLTSVSTAKLEICLNHTNPVDLEWSIAPPNSTNTLALPLPTPLGMTCDTRQGQLHSLDLLSTTGSNPVTQGRWALNVKDRALGNTGTFRQWRVILQGLQ